MSRREFSVKVRTAAEKRAAGNCEGCGIGLRVGHFHFDHDVPDGLGGEPTLENCRVLCLTCHRIKTHEQDNPRMQKADRVKKKIKLGIRNRSRLQGRQFDPPRPQHTATGQLSKSLPPRRLSGEVVPR